VKVIGNVIGMALVGAVLVCVSFSAGLLAASGQMQFAPQADAPDMVLSPEDIREAEFALFWEAWELLSDEFYGDLPPLDEAARDAVKGVTQRLGDPNTFLVDPEIARVMYEDMTGKFEGIGASVRTDEDGYFTIVQPFENSPASEAGLQAGDIVLAVDGTATQGLSTTEVISMIRGPKDSTVTLLIFRPSAREQFSVDVRRDTIDIPTLEARWLRDDTVAYIRLREFNAVAAEQVRSTLQQMLRQEPAGIILDLRSNPGGLLDVSIAIASEFVGEGIIAEERFKDGTTNTFAALPYGLATSPTLPLVVLVDGASASASEIVAGAIQDTGRGLLVGAETYGKGSVQLPHQLSDGSQLRITVAHWFTPGGRDIHEQGLTPDVEIAFSLEEYEAGRDTQLEQALDTLNEMIGNQGVRIEATTPRILMGV
jgi:carboxyl-terminal processing protease